MLLPHEILECKFSEDCLVYAHPLPSGPLILA